MLVINLFGGPASGKSTLSAGLFYNLKKSNVNCELIQEYAKSRVWENATATLDDQLYVFAKQNHAQRRVYDKVDIVITDSPILLSIIYNNSYSDSFNNMILEIFNSYNNINYFINRGNDYSKVGRMQDYQEACNIDDKILNLLTNHNISFRQINQNALTEIVGDLL